MGTPAFAANILEGLLQDQREIVAVVTQTDKKVGRKQILTPSPVKEVAMAHGIPVLQPFKVRKEYEEILNFKPDLILVCAYGQIIPKALLDYPRFGCINTHGSLLPKYRGGAPIQRAIMNGETTTGITLMYMSEKMDEGDILFKKEVAISDDDTSATLFAKMSSVALQELRLHLDDIITSNIAPISQDESEATYAYNLKKSDEYIDFGDSAKKVYDHIRGLLDDPGAYAIIDDKKYKFHKVRYLHEVLGKPYEVIGMYDEALAIGCKDGTLLVDIIQSEGKKAMRAKDFFNGLGKALVGKSFSKCPQED